MRKRIAIDDAHVGIWDRGDDARNGITSTSQEPMKSNSPSANTEKRSPNICSTEPT